MSLTLTPGSRSAANAVGQVIFYQLVTAAAKPFYRLQEGFILIVFANRIFILFIMFNVSIVSICVFSVKEHLIWSLALLCVPHLRLSFLCLVQMHFFPSLF